MKRFYFKARNRHARAGYDARATTERGAARLCHSVLVVSLFGSVLSRTKFKETTRREYNRIKRTNKG